MSLGAGETTLLRMATAYCMLANGGKQVQRHADRPHPGPLGPARSGATTSASATGCKAEQWDGPGRARDRRRPQADHRPAHRLSDDLDPGGRGPARHGDRRSRSLEPCRSPARPAPPTRRRTPGSSATRPTSSSACSSATTRRKPMGKGKTGGQVAAPIFGNFMKMALADKPAAPFRIPPGIKLVRVNLRTGPARRRGRSATPSWKPSSRTRSRTTPTRSSASRIRAPAPCRAATTRARPTTAISRAPRQSPSFGSGRGGIVVTPRTLTAHAGCGVPSRLQRARTASISSRHS